jgi:hypothetical protein
MGGIKHGMWSNGPESLFPKNQQPNQLANNEAWAEWAAKETQTNCVVCGLQIIHASQDKHGREVDWQWEMQMKSHTQCYMDYMNNMRAESERTMNAQVQNSTRIEADNDGS